MIFILLIIFQLKHFIADYPLQNSYMLRKFLPGKEFILPLSAHCAVHASLTFGISLFFVSPASSLGLAFLDFILHFIMDRVKASPDLLGCFTALSKGEFKGILSSRPMCVDGLKLKNNPELVAESQRMIMEFDKRIKSNTYFWWSLGLDQMVHHLTHYLIIYFLIYR